MPYWLPMDISSTSMTRVDHRACRQYLIYEGAGFCVLQKEPKPGQEEEDAAQGVEMEADFEGDMHDLPSDAEGDDDDEGEEPDQEQQRLDQEMGEVGDAGKVVDERLWGEEDKPEEGQRPGEEKYERDAPVQVRNILLLGCTLYFPLPLRGALWAPVRWKSLLCKVVSVVCCALFAICLHCWRAAEPISGFMWLILQRCLQHIVHCASRHGPSLRLLMSPPCSQRCAQGIAAGRCFAEEIAVMNGIAALIVGGRQTGAGVPGRPGAGPAGRRQGEA